VPSEEIMKHLPLLPTSSREHPSPRRSLAATIRPLLILLAGAWLLQWQHAPAHAQAPASLNFFTNYFVTGDYVVAGVGLREGGGVNGLASGHIAIPPGAVPEGADLVAAFLYWQVVSTTGAGPDSGSAGATFKGHPLTTPDGPIAKVLGHAGSAPCWSSGGSTGPSGGQRRTYTYRADVMRYFDIDEATGKYIVNGAHHVQVPNSGGSGNQPPIAVGASVVVIYRDTTKPLNAIVLYDGGYTIDNSSREMTQTIRGFYQPANAPDDRQATITYIVGSGQSNKNEEVFFNGTLLATSPFGGFLGEAWDSPTFAVALGSDVTEVTTSVSTRNVSGPDCLTVGATIFKTAVQDTDGDGLLDVWESSPTPLLDPNGRELPLLSAMGADPLRRDVFIEIGYMHTGGEELAYGGTSQPAHTHLPGHEALQRVGDAFRNAPLTNPDGSTGIDVHFDVGADYPSCAPGEWCADAYIIGRRPGDDPGLASGGDAIHELWTVCERGAGEPPWACQFQDYPGTVGWKTGFRSLRDWVLDGPSAPESPGEDDPCDAPGNACERRFDENRRDMFRYALFAHSVGIPKGAMPCLDANGDGAPDVYGACGAGDGLTEDPEFRVPRTITGVGDFPGADVLITLGAFKDAHRHPVGTPFMQASTLLHELGHTFERRHGGGAQEPNCKPTYLSVMNYLYQLRGLVDDLGTPHLDFSRDVLPAGGAALDEGALSDGALWGLPYRIGWYAPLDGSYLAGNPFVAPARTRCDGTPVEAGERMVRIDAARAGEAIDWNANRTNEYGYEQDINFSGAADEMLAGANDWADLRLNQIGARRNVGGLFLDRHGRIGMGPMSIGAGRGDWGRGDWGQGDLGRGDWGQGDLGRGDTGRGDWGRGDWGRGDWGRGDWGRGDWGRGDWGRGDWGRGDWGQGDLPGSEGELDYALATELSKTPPREFRACRVDLDDDCDAPGVRRHYVRLDWKMPNIGDVAHYLVFRVPGEDYRDAEWDEWEPVQGTVAGADAASYVLVDEDSDRLVPGGKYSYFALAQYVEDDPSRPVVRSEPSNQVTITAANDAPTISPIANQTIGVNGSTGALSFTIGDTETLPANLVVSGSSSNTTLVPHANIAFGGSGDARTVTVTPAPNEAGTTTITVTVRDRTWTDGQVAATTFVVTVQPPAATVYAFTGFLSPLATAGSDAAPSLSGTFNFGRTLALKWQLQRNGSIVSDLTSLTGLQAVPGAWSDQAGCVVNGGEVLLLLGADGRPTGGSTYRYDATTDQFMFNWDTSAVNTAFCYRVRLTLDDGSPAKVTVVRFR
jgi:hypothetical protein